MWIFATIGCFSIVTDSMKPGWLLIRARARADIDNLYRAHRESCPSMTPPSSDEPAITAGGSQLAGKTGSSWQGSWPVTWRIRISKWRFMSEPTKPTKRPPTRRFGGRCGGYRWRSLNWIARQSEKAESGLARCIEPLPPLKRATCPLWRRTAALWPSSESMMTAAAPATAVIRALPTSPETERWRSRAAARAVARENSFRAAVVASCWSQNLLALRTSLRTSTKEGMRRSQFGQCGSVANELDGSVYIFQTGSSTWRIVGVEDVARIDRRAQAGPEEGSS